MAKRSAQPAPPAVPPDASTRVMVLHGVEEMLKRQYLDELRTALRKVHGEFDATFYDGETAALADVLDELRTFSLLQSFKMVILDQADEFLKRESQRGSHREAMTRYVQAPAEAAVLVLRCETWHKGNLDKAIMSVGQIIKCDPLPAGEVSKWVQRRATAAHGCKVSAEVAQAIIQRLGVDLMRIDSELGKLAVVAGGDGQAVTLESVEEVVGRSSDDQAWAIQEVVLGELEKALTQKTPVGIARVMIDKVHELTDLSGQSEVPIQFAVADLMRKLTYSAVLKRQKVSDFQIGKIVGIWGPAQGPILRLAEKIEPAKARKWFDRAMEMSLRGRSSLGDPLRNLECFCALLADEV